MKGRKRSSRENENLALRALIAPYRVAHGKGFRLKNFASLPTAELLEKERNEELLKDCSKRLSHYQEKLHADGRRSLLLILQGMDASGKDGAIKSALSGVDPQGVDVMSFKVPAGQELEHDFLWRCARAMPRRGRIGIFNRSYYEEVVAVRVYPHFLENQRLPKKPVDKHFWRERLCDIAHYEEYLAHNGIVLRKVFLNISRAEQKRRLLARLEDPNKAWKFSPYDIRDRGNWPNFMSAYEEAIRATASKSAPWFVVPADDKSFARLTVARIALEALEELNPDFPAMSLEELKNNRIAAEKLIAEDRKRARIGQKKR